jgi:hypothetical protein
VAESVGVEFTNVTSLWGYCCNARGWADYEMLTAAEQTTIHNSKERLLAYLLIANSSTSANHDITNNLLEAFITKQDKYPSTQSNTIGLLNKYDEKEPPPTGISEGTAFAQKGKSKNKEKGDNNKKADNKNKQSKSDKKFFIDKECYLYGKKGHGAKKCPNNIKKKSRSEDTDNSLISSKSSKLEELEKKIKSANKQVTQLKAQFEADKDTESDDDDQLHFQFMNFVIHITCPPRKHTRTYCSDNQEANL